MIVSSAGGTAWALVFRTVSSPVGLREALRIYRREQTGKVLASLRNRLPAPGVYTYRTNGGEGLSLMGVERSFPSTTSMIVADGRCATVSWVPITQHTEVTTVCDGPGGALTVPRLVTDESIAGTTTTSTITCPATAYLVPPAARPGQRWGVTCSLASPAEKVAMAGEVLGPATVVVGGHTRARRAHPLRLDLHGRRARHEPDGLLDRPEQRPHRARAGVGRHEPRGASATARTWTPRSPALDPAR